MFIVFPIFCMYVERFDVLSLLHLHVCLTCSVNMYGHALFLNEIIIRCDYKKETFDLF